jgi:metallophosphoesterase (TIGR00282 family)
LKNLLFIGDVVGSAGCDFLMSKLSLIKRRYSVDITVVNGENSAQGNGITPVSADMLVRAGADVITTGNHAFRRKEASDLFDTEYIIRPANYPEGGAPGKGVFTLDMGAYSVAVINLMGTVGLEALENPFFTADRLIDEAGTPNIIIDFHAEATSEKKALGHYLAGRVTAVLGTHTHVQTADEMILKDHTAYITDAGMCGPEISVLGIDPEIAVARMKYHYPAVFRPSSSPSFINAVVVSFDEKLGKANKIERIIMR